MRFDKTTVYPLNVEFEDIDFGGVVHHPKYFCFLERARTAAMKESGYGFQQSMKDGNVFVVAESLVKYMKPAFYEQNLYVLSRIVAARKSSLKVIQSIISEIPDEAMLQKIGDAFFELPGTIFTAQIRLVCVGKDLKPKPIPKNILNQFQIPDETTLLTLSRHKVSLDVF